MFHQGQKSKNYTNNENEKGEWTCKYTEEKKDTPVHEDKSRTQILKGTFHLPFSLVKFVYNAIGKVWNFANFMDLHMLIGRSYAVEVVCT